DEAGNIIKQATISAQKREEEILEDAKIKVTSMTQKAEAQIQQERKKAYQEIKEEISEISVSIAGKMVGREISAKDHEQLIAQFIENVGEEK
ncbi:MAG: ATP synthase F0 subunit B, partial [Oscillospiraceae bacterium]